MLSTKILLTAINAKYIHSNPAIYYLHSYAVKQDAALAEVISMAEFTINQPLEEILRGIFLQKPDVVAFSCYIWNITLVEELLAELPKILPGVEIWLGGPEVSFDGAEQLRRNPAVKGVMTGEGEATFYEVVRYYRSREGKTVDASETRAFPAERDLQHIPGIVYRTAQGDIIANPSRAYLDFDTVPFPYENLKGLEHRIVYYETSRGCPFACSYCLSSVDRKVRLRSMDLVERELQFFLDAKVPQVKFVDRTFNVQPEHTRTILTYIRDHDNGVTNFHFEIAAELLREEELELLTSLRPGLVQLEIGVQTVNPDTLAAICRKADLDRLTEIVGRLVAAGNMHIHLDLIAGLPYEDLASFRRSFDQVYRMRPEQLQLGFLKVLKGSPLAAAAGKEGAYEILYRDRPPYEVLRTQWLSYGDIQELKRVEEMLEIYHNSGQFRWSLRYLEHFYESLYELYRELAEYGERTGWLGRKHNRYDWYAHLRDFWLADHPEEVEILTTLLLHDLYSRENAKSRPDYAPDQNTPEEKERRKQFFIRGTYQDYLPGYEAYTSAQTARLVHLERVGLDPFRTAEAGKKVAWEGYLLYDYRRVHPVTQEAACQLIDSEVFV